MDDLREKLSKIDFSDIRVLLVGLVLLCIPLLFLVYIMRAPGGGGFGMSGAREKLEVTGRKGFSFARREAPAQKTGWTGGSAGSPFVPSAAESEWNSAVARIEQESYNAPDVPGMTPEGKMLLEAELNPKMRRAQMFMNANRPKEALPILEEILDNPNSNPVLQLSASSLLCEMYEKEGKTAELAAEFKRLMSLMSKVPKIGGFAANLEYAMKEMSKIPLMLQKWKSDPRGSQQIQDFLTKNNMKVTPDEYLNQINQTFKDMVPGYPNL
ncbi:MAG TPA: hypothetical protein PKO06_07935 [Candidatus Ozemobacteraceae bacterium]|nr:hypothetical protein [Candidatus Ozemobacteraceae bacterium]